MDLTRDTVFQQHRRLMFMIAYDITGSVTDAEDTVQETWLRWHGARATVTDPRAYLAKIAANQARNALRSSTRRREDYIGPWLPDPLMTQVAEEHGSPIDPEQSALRVEAVSTALLIVLQRLSEDERAAFVLREVFAFNYSDIAEALGRSEDATRQLVHRARRRVHDRVHRTPVDEVEHRRVVQRFLHAAATGDVDALLALLAPQVIVTSDGGGQATAALRPIIGAEKTLRFLLGLAEKYGSTAVSQPTELNGLLGVLFREHGTVTTTFQLDVADSVVKHIYVVRNPDKLQHLN